MANISSEAQMLYSTWTSSSLKKCRENFKWKQPARERRTLYNTSTLLHKALIQGHTVIQISSASNEQGNLLEWHINNLPLLFFVNIFSYVQSNPIYTT